MVCKPNQLQRLRNLNNTDYSQMLLRNNSGATNRYRNGMVVVVTLSTQWI
jgi:hypothetical protein